MAIRQMVPSQALQVDAADDLFDVGLRDGEVDERRAGGHVGDETGCSGVVLAESEPLASAIDAVDGGAVDLEWRGLLLEVDDEGALAGDALLDGVDATVVDHPPVVDDENARAQALDVGQVVG